MRLNGVQRGRQQRLAVLKRPRVRLQMGEDQQSASQGDCGVTEASTAAYDGLWVQ